MEQAKQAIKNFFKNIVKRHIKRIIRILVIIAFIVVVIFSSSVYWLTVDDGSYKEDDWSSTPYAAGQYKGGVSVDEEGNLKNGTTAQELWDKMVENKNRVVEYLDGPEELARLMRAEIITQYPDTRPDPDQEIKWDELIENPDLMQGIIKFKRAYSDGNKATMSYVSPQKFQNYIDEYNSTGSETAKNNALSHFTLKKGASGTLVNYSGPDLYWPTDGNTITSYFGLRDAPTAGATTSHGGIDIGVPEGTNVYACEKGTVQTAGWSDSAGNWVVIDHGNGYVTKYMHNSQLQVSAGDEVKKGQVIALAGTTGISTGPHVHFQIEYNGTPIDPLSFKYNNGMGDGTGGFGESDDKDDEKDDKKDDKEDDKKKDKDDKDDKKPQTQKATETNVDGDGYSQLYTSSAGITYKHFKQFQGSYAGNSYWDGTVSSSGCGPSSVAILASGLLGDGYTPGIVAAEMNAAYGFTSYDTLKREMDSLGMPRRSYTVTFSRNDTRCFKKWKSYAGIS